MSEPKCIVVPGVPKLALHDDPAVVTDSHTVWVGYLIADASDAEHYAIVRYDDVISHLLSPINDEGIGEHPYAECGLAWYEFQEVAGSDETEKWSALGTRHWIVTFKDRTLDVLATSCTVAEPSVSAGSALEAVTNYVGGI